ncbi:piggyBac transposable element-derived protein 3-like [Aphis craccivora]|uniref:PiggyBac transposable element-derived protein 3-like n=1 Tax=Aphis craccivora TaxID=307492 RepID=A0A6G0VK01_APHCR|nr:piggyBac transposable element-derived protein 3-like [Aphis craccivora]
MKIFVGVHLLIGCLKQTRIRLHWTSDFRVNLIADSISRNRIFELRSCFHVINNNEIPVNNKDKFIKVRLHYDSFLKHCKTLPKDTNLSIDEQVIQF